MDVTPSDVHVESARIQRQIEDYLGLGPGNLLFEFRQLDGQTRLDLITVNPRHQQSFLFRYEMGHDKLDALRKMLAYVQRYRDEESSYTIQWRARDAKELQTSYFRAHNTYEALDKLYYGRDLSTITVFSVVLNPSS
ncbi:hypothetical protein KBK19_14950 [Microvirga sp. STR05]|uniref:Uncharacterized protein n=2 Tax=Hymenobacter TaxID=89966 RepID=A0A7G7WB71_9BACT|nr:MULTISPECIES: hypothetical protein [Hymenobacter]MBD2716336.1 hypothetical protein [Hymenobacter duratus]MBR7951251.1 hypothetical protein [Microvirga sp. STR05]QNH63614.1 hypothetical protein H4317_07415 [Hymenobacter sediminicola]